MIKDILYNGVKGAFTRLVRLIVYIIIVLVITYVIGLISSKKASALVYKDKYYTQMDPYIRSGDLTQGSNQINLDFDFTNEDTIPISFYQNYDLVALQIQRFAIRGINVNHTISCTSSNAQAQTVTYFCNDSDPNANYYGNGTYWTLMGFAHYKDGSSSPCWTSSELNDMILCPLDKTSPLDKMSIRLTTIYTLSQIHYEVGVGGWKYFYNYDSTDIINSNGTIVNNQTTIIQEQQQQNQWAQSNTVSGAESSAQSGISTLQTTLNNKMSSVNGLTQVVLAPITMFTNLASNSCTPIQLTAPFVNTTFQLPCMSGIYNQHFGILITLFATVIGGITGYWLCINIAKLIKELVDCDNDRIEVIDL